MIRKFSNFSEFKNQYNALIFTDEKCIECYKLKADYPILINEFTDVEFFEIDAFEFSDLSTKYEIYTLPSIVLFKGTTEVARFNHGLKKNSKYIINFIKVFKGVNK